MTLANEPELAMSLNAIHRATAGHRFLLFALIGLLLIYPMLSGVLIVRAFLDVFVFIVLVAGVRSASMTRRTLIVSGCLALTVFVTSTVADYYSHPWLVGLSLVSGCVFFTFVVATLLRKIFLHSDDVSAETIYGSISVYLLIGLAFAFLYMFMDFVDTASFPGDDMLAGDVVQTLEGYMYFSFVTLTTLGFGDITPGTPQAGAFVYMESILGQLYLTVLVARLVGIHISKQLE